MSLIILTTSAVTSLFAAVLFLAYTIKNLTEVVERLSKDRVVLHEKVGRLDLKVNGLGLSVGYVPTPDDSVYGEVDQSFKELRDKSIAPLYTNGDDIAWDQLEEIKSNNEQLGFSKPHATRP